VQACGGRISRAQVRTASAALCRDGDLDRVRSGVYQWAGGTRAARTTSTGPATSASPTASPVSPSATLAAHLFNQMCPHGMRMTAEHLADVEQWMRLTEKLVEHAQAS